MAQALFFTSAFDQDLSGWDVSSVDDVTTRLQFAGGFALSLAHTPGGWV